MKKTYLFLGCLLLIGSAFFIKDELVNLKILKSGRLVDMRIIDIPNSCVGTKAKWFMKIQYGSKVFSKQIPSGFCEKYNKGDLIKLRYLEEETRVLLPNENLTLEFVSISVFFILGILLVISGLRKT
ncbi:hypothetical protein [Mucilaginibacter sp. HD30]